MFCLLKIAPKLFLWTLPSVFVPIPLSARKVEETVLIELLEKRKKNVWPIHHVQQQLVRAFLLVAEGVNIFYPVTFAASGIELLPLYSGLSRGVSATWAGNSHEARVCETIENSNKFEITNDVSAFKSKELTWPWPLEFKGTKRHDTLALVSKTSLNNVFVMSQTAGGCKLNTNGKLHEWP